MFIKQKLCPFFVKRTNSVYTQKYLQIFAFPLRLPSRSRL